MIILVTREALYRVNKSKTKQETWHKTQSEGVRLLFTVGGWFVCWFGLSGAARTRSTHSSRKPGAHTDRSTHSSRKPRAHIDRSTHSMGSCTLTLPASCSSQHLTFSAPCFHGLPPPAQHISTTSCSQQTAAVGVSISLLLYLMYQPCILLFCILPCTELAYKYQ
jgi:hypothetical protein